MCIYHIYNILMNGLFIRNAIWTNRDLNRIEIVPLNLPPSQATKLPNLHLFVISD